MSRVLFLSGLGVLAAVLFTVALVRAAASRWEAETAELVEDLVRASARDRGGPATYDPVELAGLPAPVQRYFRFALVPGQPLVERAVLTQAGEMARARDQWFPFTATETFTVQPPGFVWDADARMLPIPTYVRDSYRNGDGQMLGAVLGLVPIVRMGGTRAMAESSLLRWLAEVAWLPTALLPSAGVRWSAVDDTTARATITDGGVTVSMTVRFAEDGAIAEVSAMRAREVDGATIEAPWVGRFRDYVLSDGMMVPGWSEVGWVVDGEWQGYWRGRNVQAAFTYRTPVRARSAGDVESLRTRTGSAAIGNP